MGRQAETEMQAAKALDAALETDSIVAYDHSHVRVVGALLLHEAPRAALLDALGHSPGCVAPDHYRKVWQEERDRAERAERERDQLREGLEPMVNGLESRRDEGDHACPHCGGQACWTVGTAGVRECVRTALPVIHEAEDWRRLARAALSADADADAEPDHFDRHLSARGKVKGPGEPSRAEGDEQQRCLWCRNWLPSCWWDPEAGHEHAHRCVYSASFTRAEYFAAKADAEGGRPREADNDSEGDDGRSRAIDAVERVEPTSYYFTTVDGFRTARRRDNREAAEAAIDAALASGGVVDVMEHKKALEAEAAKTDEWKARIRELEAVLRAIAEHDWETLRRIGGDVWHRADLYSTPADFDLEGDFEADARHVYPARNKAITQAARAALEGGE